MHCYAENAFVNENQVHHTIKCDFDKLNLIFDQINLSFDQIKLSFDLLNLSFDELILSFVHLNLVHFNPISDER